MRSFKRNIQYLLQRVFGLKRYLYAFALYTIRKLETTEQEQSLVRFAQLVNTRFSEGQLVDVGANIGVTVAFLASKTTHRIVAIEPASLNLEVLRSVAAHFHINSRVEFFQCAVGSVDDSCVISIPMNDGVVYHGLSSVHSDAAGSAHASNSFSEERVPLFTLDTLLAERPIAAMKIDVENFEYEVLKGARHILSNQHPVLLIELWNNEVRSQCFDLLQELGYISFVLRGQKFVPLPDDTSSDLDFLFVHRSRASVI